MDFIEVQHHALQLKARYAARDTMLEEMRRMFHMEWETPPSGDWIKPTMSPSAYNAAMGAIRLLTSTEPQLSVPFDEGDDDAQQTSEKLERAAKGMLSGSGRALLMSPHREVVLSGVLSGEVCGSVTKVADLIDYATKSKNKAHLRRMEALAVETPYVFKIYDARTCYPDYDAFGMRGMLRVTKTTYGEVLDTWGKMAEEAGVLPTTDRLTEVNVWDWYDWERRCVWVEGHSSQAILDNEHDLKFLPVVAMITDGSMMFDRPDLQRNPFLYSLWKSDLWKRENLSLTMIYSLLFTVGNMPLLKLKTRDPSNRELAIDRTIPGGTVKIGIDEDLSPLAEKIVDPEQWKALEMARGLTEESTISKRALGGSATSAMSFSALSLLAQSGRLPLMGPKTVGGAAIASLLRIALQWYRDDGKDSNNKIRLYAGKGKFVELSPKDVPERVVLECNLEPDLPQDKLQQANVGESLVRSELASKRWVQENILQIGQSDQMTREILFEKWFGLEVQKMMQMAMTPPSQPSPIGQPPIGEGVNGAVPPGGVGMNAGGPLGAPVMAEGDGMGEMNNEE